MEEAADEDNPHRHLLAPDVGPTRADEEATTAPADSALAERAARGSGDREGAAPEAGPAPRQAGRASVSGSSGGGAARPTGLVSLNGSSPAAPGASRAESSSVSAPSSSWRAQGRAPRAGPRGREGEGEGVIDSLGREITAIVAPVSICMFLVVCFVLILTPNGAAEGALVPTVGALVYQEKSTDSSMEKFEGGLENAAAFVVMVAGLTFGLVALFYFRCTRFIWLYMAFSGFIILACLGGYVAVAVIQVFSIPLDVVTFAVLLYNVSVVGVLAVFFCRMPIFMTQAYLVLIAAVVAFWFTHLPEWTTWLILIAMAVYDLVAVLAPGGPLKLLLELAMEREEELPALIYEARPPPIVAPLPLHVPQPVVVSAAETRRDAPRVRVGDAAGPTLRGSTSASGEGRRLEPSAIASGGGKASVVPRELGHAAPTTEGEGGGVPKRLLGRFDRRLESQELELGPEGGGISGARLAAAGAVDSGVVEGFSGDQGLQGVASRGAGPGSQHDIGLQGGESSPGRSTSKDRGRGTNVWAFLTSRRPAQGDSAPSAQIEVMQTAAAAGHAKNQGGRGSPKAVLRLEVPVDNDGTAVVVSRQHSPVRRTVSRSMTVDEDGRVSPLSPGAGQPVASPDFRLRQHSGRLDDARSNSGSSRALGSPMQTTQEGASTPQDAVSGGSRLEESQPSRRGAAVRPPVNPSPVPADGQGEGPRAPGSERSLSAELGLPGAIKLGLGDFIFYSIMVGRAAMYDMMTVYACYLAIVAGLGATLILLAVTRRALPALPFSIALGVLFYLLTRMILEPFVIALMMSLLYF